MVLTDPRGLPFFSWAVAAKSDGDQDQSKVARWLQRSWCSQSGA
jgi:hypothetical protein